MILPGQTVLWIGAQFCVCFFLVSTDKFLNMLKIFRNYKKNCYNKSRTKGASFLQNSLQFTKCTVRLRNAQAKYLQKIELVISLRFE